MILDMNEQKIIKQAEDRIRTSQLIFDRKIGVDYNNYIRRGVEQSGSSFGS